MHIFIVPYGRGALFQLVFSNCIDKECAEDGQLKDLRWSFGKAIVLFHYLRHYIYTHTEPLYRQDYDGVLAY